MSNYTLLKPCYMRASNILTTRHKLAQHLVKMPLARSTDVGVPGFELCLCSQFGFLLMHSLDAGDASSFCYAGELLAWPDPALQLQAFGK